MANLFQVMQSLNLIDATIVTDYHEDLHDDKDGEGKVHFVQYGKIKASFATIDDAMNYGLEMVATKKQATKKVVIWRRVDDWTQAKIMLPGIAKPVYSPVCNNLDMLDSEIRIIAKEQNNPMLSRFWNSVKRRGVDA